MMHNILYETSYVNDQVSLKTTQITSIKLSLENNNFIIVEAHIVTSQEQIKRLKDA
jgi:hypothetical protein